MKLIIQTNHRELTVAIKVRAKEDCDIRIDAYDKDNPKTYFLTREKQFKGDCVFKIKLPISPKTLIVNIYNAYVGNKPAGQDKSFEVLKVYGERLQRNAERVNWNKYNLKEFVDFASRFSYNLNYLPPGTYKSDKGNFIIQLLPEIKDHESGRVLNTPARVAKATGKIEVSKAAFDSYTVPSRMAILCHEVSHFHINSNPDDESEADLNGLTIYLALGFPVVEAYDAFIDVFTGAPTEANKERYDILDKFIRSFNKQQIFLK